MTISILSPPRSRRRVEARPVGVVITIHAPGHAEGRAFDTGIEAPNRHGGLYRSPVLEFVLWLVWEFVRLAVLVPPLVRRSDVVIRQTAVAAAASALIGIIVFLGFRS